MHACGQLASKQLKIDTTDGLDRLCGSVSNAADELFFRMKEVSDVCIGALLGM
jgi:hypothetical protein